MARFLRNYRHKIPGPYALNMYRMSIRCYTANPMPNSPISSHHPAIQQYSRLQSPVIPSKCKANHKTPSDAQACPSIRPNPFPAFINKTQIHPTRFYLYTQNCFICSTCLGLTGQYFYASSPSRVCRIFPPHLPSGHRCTTSLRP